jgi:hypothetical protein
MRLHRQRFNLNDGPIPVNARARHGNVGDQMTGQIKFMVRQHRGDLVGAGGADEIATQWRAPVKVTLAQGRSRDSGISAGVAIFRRALVSARWAFAIMGGPPFRRLVWR